MSNKIFGYGYATGVVTQERNMGTLHTKVTQSVGDPKQLGTTTSGSNILSFCGRLSYTWLFAKRPRNKWGTQKLASTRSVFPIDMTPHKVGIWKTKKRKRGGHRVPKTKLRSVSKIPEDSLEGLKMWCSQRHLKMSVQTHRELNVQPRCCQVQEGANHAPVLLLVHKLSVLVRVYRCSRTHRCW
jgi:hypothetical protein